MSLTFPSQRMWKEAGMGGKGTSPRGRAEVLISFTWLTQSQWQADGCTLNATFFFFFFFFTYKGFPVASSATKKSGPQTFHLPPLSLLIHFC